MPLPKPSVSGFALRDRRWVLIVIGIKIMGED